MQTRLPALSSVFLVLVGTLAAPADEPRHHGDEAKAANLDVKTLHALDVALQNQVDNKHVAGVIGLVARHGEIGYFESFGQRAIEKDAPMSKDTLFRIYSMTKPVVAVTAMSLWQEGKFKLDDPISVHLPHWEKATVKTGDRIVPVENPITPRHLMTHSSGMTYEKNGLNLGRDATLSEFSQSMAKQPLKFQPGTDYFYGYSIDILGHYIEAIEGKSLDVVMRERVFDRLGMKDTAFWIRDSADRHRVAQVYGQSEPGELKPAMRTAAVMSRPSRMMGGQGLLSTTADYARFCQMLLNKGELDGQHVLNTETVELMFKNHLQSIGKVYGLGGVVDGKGGYSWGGAAGTRFWIDPSHDCYGVFMIQTWRYTAPTYQVFRRHVGKALVVEQE